MRVRSVLITAVAGAAFFAGSMGAAHATPKGPGGLGNTPTTVKPQCCKDIQNPTPTTTPPKPKGPGDISDTPKDPVVDPKPVDPQDGPDDIAPVPKDDGVVTPPADNGGSSVDTSNGAGATDTAIADATVATDTVDATHEATQPADHEGSRVPTFLIIFFALLVAGLIGFVATRLRSEDEDVESV